MTKNFKPGTIVRIAANATWGGGDCTTRQDALNRGLGEGPWIGTIKRGSDGDRDYRIAIDPYRILYAHRNFVTEIAPLPVGTRVNIPPIAVWRIHHDNYNSKNDSLSERIGGGPWTGTVEQTPNKYGNYLIKVDGADEAVYAYAAYVSPDDEDDMIDATTEIDEIDVTATAHHLTTLLQAVTAAGYRATRIKVAATSTHGAFTIRVDQM